MKRTILALTLFSIPAWPQAETSVKTFKYNGNGYTFFSAGTCLHGYANVGVGGGGEAFIWRGLTIGGEIGYFRFTAYRNTGYGIATLNPGYHFVDREKPAKWDPYVSVSVMGRGFATRPGLTGRLNGGVNYWFKEKIGLQTGAQFQAIDREALVMFRIGLTFR